MAKHFGETAHGSCTAFIKQVPDTGGEALEAKMEYLFDPTQDVWLEDIRVLPEAQGKGEGKELMDELLVKAAGCRRIIGVFTPSNLVGAATLYKDAGFKIKKSDRDPSIYYVILDLKKNSQ